MKLHWINPDLADELIPQLPESEKLWWIKLSLRLEYLAIK
jgi:hypothetical protein